MDALEGPAAVVTLVTSPGCHLCQDARYALEELQHERALDLRIVEGNSTEGLSLVARHRPALLPLVLVAGEFFSAGRLPRGKLRRALARGAGR